MIDQEKEKKEEGLEARLDEQKDPLQDRRQANARNDLSFQPNKRILEKAMTSADSNSAGAMEPIGSATVTADKSEIQSGPENSGKSLGVLNARETVTVIGQVGDELKIIANGKVGYIAAKSTDFSPSQTPGARPDAAHRSASVAVAALNVRTGPSKDATVIGTLRNADKINVYGEKDGFLEIHVGGQTAYIAAEYTDDAQKYGKSAMNDTERDEIQALCAKDTLTAQEIARLRKRIAHLSLQERGDILEDAQKKQAPNNDHDTADGYDALASCLTFLGVDNPSPDMPFTTYLAQLKHIQKVQRTGGMQNWGNIANLMGMSYQAIFIHGCSEKYDQSLWTQTVRNELRCGNAVMASFEGRPVRITAIDDSGITCTNASGPVAHAFDELQTDGPQWIISLFR